MEHTHISLHWAHRLSFVSRKTLTARFRAAGHQISAEDWALLLVLWQNGPQTPGALADATIKDRTTVTRLLDALVRKGLAQRREDPQDRRRSLVSVTAKGAALRDQLTPIAQALIDSAQTGLSPQDIATTTRCLRQMTEALQRAEKDSP